MGKIEIDHTGTGSGITLSSDGTSLLLDGTAIGGSALELFAENPSTPTAPSATGTNAVAIGDSAVSSGSRSTGIGLSYSAGSNSFVAAGTTNSSTYGAWLNSGIAMGAQAKAESYHSVAIGELASCRSERSIAVGNYSSVGTNAGGSFAGMGTVGNIAANSVAIKGTSSANSGLAIGRNSVAAGTYAVALSNSRAGSTNAIAIGIYDNTSSYGATGVHSVAIGYQAKATGQESLSFGSSNTVSVDYSGAYGRGNTISGGSGGTQFAFGAENSTSSTLAFAFGYKANAPTSKFAFANSRFSTNGDAQQGIIVLRSDTTDATAEALTVNNSSLDSSNQIILPNNSAFAFHGTIVARQDATSGTACAAWKVEGLIRREGSAGTTTLVNSATTVLDNTPSWGMALSADTTYGALKIEVTGAASTNIRWVATIHTSEVIYA